MATIHLGKTKSYIVLGHGTSLVKLLTCALVLGLGGKTQAASTTTLVCELRGAQENPPTNSPARGCGRFEINRNTNTITFRIAFGGLTTPETAAHFHRGTPGVNGPVVIGLPSGNPKSGVVTYAEADEADILAGRWYVNIHTAMFPGGEIRGQMNSFAAFMDGPQENPAVGLPSQGWGTFNIDLCANRLNYHIVVESLGSPETAAHIHGMALQGTNAGILHPLPPGMIKTGSWIYNEAQEPAILAGLLYVNVHTVVNPGGEIRGQIVNTVVPIDAAQETPPVPAPLASGCGYIAHDPLTNTMGFYFLHGGLTSPETAAHIHGFAPPGVAAPVLFGLPPGSPKKGTWTYGAADAAAVHDGRTYVNIHTSNFPGGEIRGQIIFAKRKCAGDTNCNGTVNVDDLLVVINAWGACMAPPVPCPADSNYSGAINVDDLLIVINGWGKCP